MPFHASKALRNKHGPTTAKEYVLLATETRIAALAKYTSSRAGCMQRCCAAGTHRIHHGGRLQVWFGAKAQIVGVSIFI